LARDGPPPDPLPTAAGLDELVTRFAGEREWRDAVLVVDVDRPAARVVSATDIEQAVRNRSRPAAADLAAATPVLHAEQTLEEALGQLVQHHGDGLPVLGVAVRWSVGSPTATCCTPTRPPEATPSATAPGPAPASRRAMPAAGEGGTPAPPWGPWVGDGRRDEPSG
jgi:hypothetical protein